MSDLNHICNRCHSLWQCRNLNSLSRARGQTCILMCIIRVLNLLSYNGKYLHMCFWNILFFPFSFFGYVCSMHKFLGQESNLCHRSNLSHSTDNTESLTPKENAILTCIYVELIFFFCLKSLLSKSKWGPFTIIVVTDVLGFIFTVLLYIDCTSFFSFLMWCNHEIYPFDFYITGQCYYPLASLELMPSNHTCLNGFHSGVCALFLGSIQGTETIREATLPMWTWEHWKSVTCFKVVHRCWVRRKLEQGRGSRSP